MLPSISRMPRKSHDLDGLLLLQGLDPVIRNAFKQLLPPGHGDVMIVKTVFEEPRRTIETLTQISFGIKKNQLKCCSRYAMLTTIGILLHGEVVVSSGTSTMPARTVATRAMFNDLHVTADQDYTKIQETEAEYKNDWNLLEQFFTNFKDSLVAWLSHGFMLAIHVLSARIVLCWLVALAGLVNILIPSCCPLSCDPLYCCCCCCCCCCCSNVFLGGAKMPFTTEDASLSVMWKILSPMKKSIFDEFPGSASRTDRAILGCYDTISIIYKIYDHYQPY